MSYVANEQPTREELYRLIIDTAAQKTPAPMQTWPQLAPKQPSFFFPWEQSQCITHGSTSTETNGR